jgi:hypothetical protein
MMVESDLESDGKAGRITKSESACQHYQTRESRPDRKLVRRYV